MSFCNVTLVVFAESTTDGKILGQYIWSALFSIVSPMKQGMPVQASSRSSWLHRDKKSSELHHGPHRAWHSKGFYQFCDVCENS